MDQSAPTGVNNTAQTVDTILQNDVAKIAETAVEKAAETALPFLLTPVVKQAFELLVEEVSDALFVEIAKIVTFEIIDIQVGTEKNNYMTAEGALHAALLTGDQNAIALARQNYKTALGALIHADGSSSPT